jgi:hypothetical protein
MGMMSVIFGETKMEQTKLAHPLPRLPPLPTFTKCLGLSKATYINANIASSKLGVDKGFHSPVLRRKPNTAILASTNQFADGYPHTTRTVGRFDAILVLVSLFVVGPSIVINY